MADTLVTTPPVDTPPASPAVPATTPAAPLSPVAPTAPPDWRATLPDDLKTDKSLEKFKGPAELARSYKQLEAYQGRSVAIPGPDAKPEEVSAFWAKVGAHDAPEKYTVPVADGEAIDAAMLAPYQAAAHAAHLTQDQWMAMVAIHRAQTDPKVQAEKLEQQAVTMLRSEWGGGFDYNIKMARGGVGYAERMSGAAGLQDFLHDSGLGNHPLLVKVFKWVGKTHAESGGIPTDARMGGVLTPDQAQQKITELMATPEYRRADRDAVNEVQRLFQLKEQA